MTRPHRGHWLHPHPLATAGAVHPAADERGLRTFRHRAPLFSLLDHEAAPAAVAALAAGAAILIAAAAVEGRVVEAAGDHPTVLAWLALLCLTAAVVAGAGVIAAWLLARPVGWDLARAAAGIEEARAALRRLAHLDPPEEPGLRAAAHRVDLAIEHLGGRLDDADAAMRAYAALPDPTTRASRLRLLRAESQGIVAAAEAIDGARHLLLWIEACPWSAARQEALARLRADLDAAERLVTGEALD